MTPYRVTWFAALAFLLILLSGCGTDSPKVVTDRATPGISGTAESKDPDREVILPANQFPCPVTAPNGATPSGEATSPDRLGNGALWTTLWPGGKVIFEPGGPGSIEPDGSLAMKWPWWRGVAGRLEIEGGRLDAPSTLRAFIPEGYGNSGFQASALIFSGPGCWEVTARIGDRSLTFVTTVELKTAAASNHMYELPMKVCIDDNSWQRPDLEQQSAHINADNRYAPFGTLSRAQFQASFWRGIASADLIGTIVDFSGLWTVAPPKGIANRLSAGCPILFGFDLLDIWLLNYQADAATFSDNKVVIRVSPRSPGFEIIQLQLPRDLSMNDIPLSFIDENGVVVAEVPGSKLWSQGP